MVPAESCPPGSSSPVTVGNTCGLCSEQGCGKAPSADLGLLHQWVQVEKGWAAPSVPSEIRRPHQASLCLSKFTPGSGANHSFQTVQTQSALASLCLQRGEGLTPFSCLDFWTEAELDTEDAKEMRSLQTHVWGSPLFPNPWSGRPSTACCVLRAPFSLFLPRSTPVEARH